MLSIFGAFARRVPRSVALVGMTSVTAGTVLVRAPSDLVLAHAHPRPMGENRTARSGFRPSVGGTTATVVRR